MGILVEVAALAVSSLTAIHALAGILRKARVFSHLSARESQYLRRADSVYGTSTVNRTLMDAALVMAIVLVVVGLFLSNDRPQTVAPTALLLAQGILLSYKPYKALQQSNEHALSQFFLLISLVSALIHEPKSKKSKGDDDVEDEKELGKSRTQMDLAAEILRLRRRVHELEGASDPPE